ncbi:MAG: SOS response-associated peptidase [Caloramator sp.]|nr:SOS response-associated peptidase [Caloramator sp.]
MCGRYWLEDDLLRISNYFGLKIMDFKNFTKGEVFPTNFAPIITKNVDKILEDVDKIILVYKWGFLLQNKAVFNARAETVHKKPFFRDSFVNRRCLAVANAFFEWKKEGKDKVKYKIKKESRFILLGGIYNSFKVRESIIDAFTILTTPPNKEMEKIHDRMPLIVDEKDMDAWLFGDLKEAYRIININENNKLYFEIEENEQLKLI